MNFLTDLQFPVEGRTVWRGVEALYIVVKTSVK